MRKRREMDAANAADIDRLRRLNDQGEQGGLYTELWRACAGGNVYIPRCGERVFYFPQGHLEQVGVYTQDQHDSHMELPVHNLPSKILCRVSCVQLKAETYTDEVFAQLILIPERQQHEPSSQDEDNDTEIPNETTPFSSFSKILTPSDTSTHGGLSVPKRHADECFRPLDMTQQTPTADIVAKDVHGFEWHFRHIYRGQPKRHLITSGWSTFVSSKRLVAGDSCIFVSGENGEIRVGIRRAVKHQGNGFPSLISGLSMKLGILANMEHAVTSGCMFIVYYHPWMYPNQFVVPLRQYLKSTMVDYPIGMRVQKKYEIYESVRRYPGTIIGYEDIDHIRWPGSKWRCLKVQWDNILENRHPERVCPWWVEPLDPANERHDPVLPAPKRAHVLNRRPLPGLSGFALDDVVQNSAKPASQTQRMDRDLQGQDFNAIQRPPSTDIIRPSKVSFGSSRLGRENLNQFTFLIKDPLRKCLGRSMPFTNEDLSISSSNISSIGSESLEWPPESRNENDAPFGQPGSSSSSRYKLFGVSLIDSQPELPSQQFAFSKTCKKCRSVNNRTCTKVLKLGTALGRAVDLTRFPGYQELIAELDSMFDFGGSLINGTSGWHVTCIDDDGDMTLLGDYPWMDFPYVVQKMIICPKDGDNNLNPSSSANPPSH